MLPTKTVFLGRGFFSRLGAATFRRHLGCSHLRDLSWDFVFVPLSSLLWRAGGESDWGSETSPCVPQDWLTPTHRAVSQHSAAYLAYAHTACHISVNQQSATDYEIPPQIATEKRPIFTRAHMAMFCLSARLTQTDKQAESHRHALPNLRTLSTPPALFHSPTSWHNAGPLGSLLREPRPLIAI